MHYAIVFSTSKHSTLNCSATKWLEDLVYDCLFLKPTGEAYWLNEGSAAELICQPESIFSSTNLLNKAAFQALRNAAAARHLDVNIISLIRRRKKLLVADMDSTIITSESLDNLADLAGIGDVITNITKRSMAGKIDFKDALVERVAMLAGTSSHFFETLAATAKLTRGAIELVKTMSANGAKCYLISGGFDFIAKPIAALCGFDNYHANHMQVANGKILGTVKMPILGRAAKVNHLNHYCKIQGIDANDAVAVGDGANDLGMLQATGMGVAFKGTPLLREHITIQLNYTDLSGLLYLQGYQKTDIITC